MTLRRRLTRLEQATGNAQRGWLESESVFARIAQYKAYFLGEGPRPPDPPCPPWCGPAAWESRMRISRCFDLPKGEFLPEMNECERQRAAMLRQAFENAALRAAEPPVTDNQGFDA